MQGFQILKSFFEKHLISEKSLKVYHAQLQEKCLHLEQKNSALERLLSQKEQKRKEQEQDHKKMEILLDQSKSAYQKELIDLQNNWQNHWQKIENEKKSWVDKCTFLTQKAEILTEKTEVLKKDHTQLQLELQMLQSQAQKDAEKIAQQQVNLMAFQKQQNDLNKAYAFVVEENKLIAKKNHEHEVAWAASLSLRESAEKKSLMWSEMQAKFADAQQHITQLQMRCEGLSTDLEEKKNQLSRMQELYFQERREKNRLSEKFV
jgi:chromosome segregation ATPase